MSKLQDKGGRSDALGSSWHNYGKSVQFSPLMTDPELAELLACQRAINLAREVKVHKLGLESNNKEVVNKIPSAEKDMSLYDPLVEEIKGEYHTQTNVR